MNKCRDCLWFKPIGYTVGICDLTYEYVSPDDVCEDFEPTITKKTNSP